MLCIIYLIIKIIDLKVNCLYITYNRYLICFFLLIICLFMKI